MAAICAGAIRGITPERLSDREIAIAIPDVDGVSVDGGLPLLLVRVGGRITALSAACPHEGAAVRWAPKTGRFECTKHDSRYQRDGTYISGRATRPLDRFPIRRVGPQLIVTIDRILRSDRDAAAWAAAVVEMKS